MNEVYFIDGGLDQFVSRVLADSRPAHFIVCGTKPDLIKQAPILQELLKQGEKAFLIHTGQHYDENLSGGIEKEFGLKVDVNLKVSGGSLTDNVAKIIMRSGKIFEAIKARNPELSVLTYVHGDTSTCFSLSTASFSHGYPSVHIEAGIRTMMIKKEVLESFDFENFDFMAWQKVCKNPENFSKGSHEPFPEQFNTRATEAGAGLFFAPVRESAENLLNEGFPESRIFTVGNSVVDAANFVGDIPSDIFEQFPKLADGFIRFCVHRRENTENQERFEKLFETVELLSTQSEKPVLWILLPGTKSAIKRFGLESRLEVLRKKENMILSDVWPKYSDVMAAMKRCSLCATDSGSMQEEMNLLQIPCATLRFGSDRAETFFAKSNILCPIIESKSMAQILLEALAHTEKFEFPAIYGENVSEKIVERVREFLEGGGELLRLNP